MQRLDFLNPVFNRGNNLTVRRGTKWSNVKGTVKLPGGKMANIFRTYVKRFKDITPQELAEEHDPTCRDLPGLLKAMKRAYGNEFDEMEIVTLVFFEEPYPHT